MHVSVTTLGADAGGVGRAVDQIVGYLEGDQAAPSQQRTDSPSRGGSQGPDVTPLADGLTWPAGRDGYYADSAEAPGRWRGEGAGPEGFELGRIVEPEAFKRVLLGQHPHTGERLVAAKGSAGRVAATDRHHGVPAPTDGDPAGLLSTAQVAKLADVDQSYVQRIVKRTAAIRAEQAAAVLTGALGPETPATYLDATKGDNGQWSIARAEVERFMTARKQPQVVLGYDITWSVPKSVSAMRAQGDERLQVEIDAAIESAVSVGMGYLETEGFHVRVGRDRQRAHYMVAASYRHDTNRSLEPQLHEHVVVANMATTDRGEARAVDARGLHAHATPAGYLAAAQLRYEMRDRLGVEWGEVYKGLADVAGVGRDAIMAVSSRRQDVLSLSEELGFHTPQARQIAALATRPGKDHSVEANELRARWKDLLTDAGLSETKVNELLDRGPVRLWRPQDTEDLFAHLASSRGVTEQRAIFDRRDVIMAVAEHAVDRLPAAEIYDLADHWLATEAVVPLEIGDGARRETIGHGSAQVSIAPDETRYSTPQMIAIDERVTRLHHHGIATDRAVVDPVMVERAINHTRHVTGIELGADQAAMVRAITTSGDQYQAVVGRAGAGKTTATQAAVTAWHEAGYAVIGAAPFAEAARSLEAETGLRSQTLEGLLTRIETAGDPRDVIGASTVIVVDEASTIGNRQLDRLYRAANETGAAVRTIGDPLQHQSVEAGGLWHHLTTRFVNRTPVLDVNRRQVGDDMGEVRLALDEYRLGLIAAALARLDADDRIVTADSWDELLDQMSADWYLDHQRHRDGTALGSKMIAERNSDRHALNQRAQQWLRQDGTLGQGAQIGAAARFHVGDRVVAQTKNTDLTADGASRRDHLINGSQGTITALKGSRRAPDLVVDFDGLGSIRVPNEFVANQVGPGRGGGLTPAYAVTSFKAEGQTYDTGRNLAAPGVINPEGMYVALTRGRNNQRTYSIAPHDRIDERPELPIITDQRQAVDALIDGLAKPKGADLATVADPDAAEVAALAARPLSDLTPSSDYHQQRATRLAEQRIAAAELADPDPVTTAALGPRPDRGEQRLIWDAAVGQAAIYRARWDAHQITITGGVPSPIAGNPPEQFDHYDRVTAAIERADRQRLETVPLQRLITERQHVAAALDTTPRHDHMTATANAAAAAHALTNARSRHNQAKARLGTLQIRGHDRPFTDPNKIETARRRVNDSARDVGAARGDLAAANRRLAATEGNHDAHLEIAARLGAIDRAIDRRITTAVQRPAGYLTTAIGPRPPTSGPAREGWTYAATAIETYRHRHLGLSPSDGAQPGKGKAAAIGPRPKPGADRDAWAATRAAIDDYLTNPQQHQRVAPRRIQ